MDGNSKKPTGRIAFRGNQGGEQGQEATLTPSPEQVQPHPILSPTPEESIASREREAAIDWITESFQMEMEQGRVFAGTFLFVEGIQRHAAEDQYRRFILALYRAVYGKSILRYPDQKQPLKHVGMVEGGDSTHKQVHYHSILVNPIDRTFTDEVFIALIQKTWIKTPKKMKNPELSAMVVKVYDLKDWVRYQTKFSTKDIQVGNSYLDMLVIKTLKI